MEEWEVQEQCKEDNMNDNNSLELYLLNLFAKSLSLICSCVGLACLLADLIRGDITILRFICWTLGSTMGMSGFFYASDMGYDDDEW